MTKNTTGWKMPVNETLTMGERSYQHYIFQAEVEDEVIFLPKLVSEISSTGGINIDIDTNKELQPCVCWDENACGKLGDQYCVKFYSVPNERT